MTRIAPPSSGRPWLGAVLTSEAARPLINPQPIEQSRLGIAVLLLALLLTAALLGFQRFIVRRTGSIAIQAHSLHYRSELGALTFGAVLRVRVRAPA